MSFSFREKPRLSDRIRGKSGDELLNELKEQFDQDRKMFFETTPKWGPGPMSGSFSRTGFPFDDDMMPRSRQDIRSHLDDLAARHPEFADHLRCPPWGGEVGSSQNRGHHKESDCDDDARSQTSGVSSSSSEPHGPDTGAQGPLPHYGLRNTVDLGQKQQEADQEEKQGRGQRSMSAPPDNRSQQSGQPQRFVTRVEIPMNAAGTTSGAAADGCGKPPVAPKQSTQQNQSTPSKQQGNVRHIPIFVEGRDEPILPKNVAPDHVEQVFAPKTVQPEVEHIFSPRQASQPAQSFARPSQFYPQQPTPASPKQQHVKPQQTVPTKSEHTVPIKVQHTSHSSKAPTKPPYKQGEHTIPIKVQHTSTSQQPPKSQHTSTSQHTSAAQQPAKPPSKPPEPVAKDPISRVKIIQKDVEQLRSQVQQYSGTSRKDKEYIYLDEMLTRNLLKLDDIETEGKENVRQARKEVIKMIQQCISELEAKVPVPEEISPSDEQEPMEEVPTEQTDENPSQEESKSENVESSEMEITSVDNAPTAQEEKQEDPAISNSSNEMAHNTEVQSSPEGTNKQKSKDMPMQEVNQQKGEKESREMSKNIEDQEIPMDPSAVQDILMECVEDKGTAVESTDEMAMPVEGAEDKTALESVENSKTAVESEKDKETTLELVEDKIAVDGAGDSSANTENVEKKVLPMEVEQQEAHSSELEKETECKESGSIPEQQVQQIASELSSQQIASEVSSQSCDKEMKSS